MKYGLKQFFWTLVPGIILLTLWEVAVHGDDKLRFLFAAPSMIAAVAAEELTQTALWRDSFITLSEALLGLFFGTLLGTAAGILLWGSRKVDAIARPYVMLLGAVPVFALAPVMIIWFGIGLLSKAIMAGFAVFFVSLIQSYEGAHVTADRYLGYARSLNAPYRRAALKLVVPGSLRWVMTGFKMNSGFALTGAFIAEFVSSEAGLGHYILKAGSLYDMPRVFLGLMLMSLMAAALNALAGRLQRRFF